MNESLNSKPVIDTDGREIRCPFCSYSMRGSPSLRCPECGKSCPEPFRSIPWKQLLPWEQRTGRFEAWRFVRTLVDAIVRYPRFLRKLGDRRARDIPIDRVGRLACYFVIAVVGVPALAGFVGGIARGIGVYGAGRPMEILRIFRISLAQYLEFRGIGMYGFEALPLLMELLLFSLLLRIATWASRREITLCSSVCCIAPPLFAFALFTRMVVLLSALLQVWPPRVWPPDVFFWVFGWLPIVGLTVCFAAAARLVGKAGRAEIIVWSVVVMFSDWAIHVPMRSFLAGIVVRLFFDDMLQTT